MALVPRFDPPAFMSDFNGIPGQLDAWNKAMNAWFDAVVELEHARIAQGSQQAPSETRTQFYNPTRFDPGLVVEQSIPWNGFPKELLRRYGRQQAMEQADTLWTLNRYSSAFDTPSAGKLPYRPHNEYCEWHVQRDPNTGAIVKLTFTSEPPEYWQALAGTSIEYPTGVFAHFPGDRDLLLRRYREMVSPDVQLADLFATEDAVLSDGSYLMRKGDYNPYNKWNTTLGIVHLCAPPNALVAEIQLTGDASVLYKNAQQQDVVTPDALICCAQYGGPDRNSDPTIGSAVNELARLGGFITLRNPVGLYMDHIDLAGWTAPDGGTLDDCVKLLRGSQGLVERMEIAVPASRGFTISDIRIGGEPILHGGQVAECITVHLVGLTGGLGTFNNPTIACTGRCCIDPHDARMLGRSVDNDKPTPPGMVKAFAGGEGTLPPPAAAPTSNKALVHTAAQARATALLAAPRQHHRSR